MHRLGSMETELDRTNTTFSSADMIFGDIPTPRAVTGTEINRSLSERIEQEDKSVFEYFDDWEVGSRYKLHRVLGHGSYGEVVEGIDLVSGKKVAIKRIQNVFDQPTDAKRVYREIHMRHPHIIRLLDVVAPHLDETAASQAKKNKELADGIIKLIEKNEQGETDSQTPDEDKSKYNKTKLTPRKRTRNRRLQSVGGNQPLDDIYLIFEFIDTDLYKLIMSPQYLTTQHIQTFLMQMLLGLKYLHSANVIHRDLKPANILVNENCSLKICDFGLSRIVSPEAITMVGDKQGERVTGLERGTWIPPPRPLSRCLTRHVVTRWYRAPELILLQEYSSAVDIWSVGCVLAELLSMQQESVKDCEDRMPLFPVGTFLRLPAVTLICLGRQGKSCPSLSGDGLRKLPDGQQAETNSDRMDQLSVIFDVIGTPTVMDINTLPDLATREFLRKLDTKPPKNLESIYPGADRSALSLLKAMLAFNPSKRISVEDALAHDFLAPLSMTQLPGWTTVSLGSAVNCVSQEVLSAMTEMAEDNIDDLKSLVVSEIKRYDPNIADSLPLPPPTTATATLSRGRELFPGSAATAQTHPNPIEP